MKKEQVVATTATNTAPAVRKERNITDGVLGRVNDMTEHGELQIPADYSPENALKSAWLNLQEVRDKSGKLAIESCSKESVANALLDMVVQGITPAKNQCYFIPYGDQLQLQRSYMGTVAVAKRFSDVKDVFAQCVFSGDEFDYAIDVATGNKIITKHTQKLENIDITRIKAVYAVVVRENTDNFTEIMTMEQVRKAWGQGKMNGTSGAHKNFTEEMAKKTVINRACKMFINTSNDNPILTAAYNRTTESDYDKADRQKYSGETVIDVVDAEVVDNAAGAIFGAKAEPKTEAEAEEKSDVKEDILTDEEKAEILAKEADAAEQEAENE